MTDAQVSRLLRVWTLALVVGVFLVAQFSPAPNVGFRDSASVLAIVTATAVGIERILELIWTAVGLTRGAWWPLSVVNEQVDSLVNSLSRTLEPFYEQARRAADAAASAGRWAADRREAAKKEIDGLEARVRQLQAMAPDNQRVQLVAASALQTVSYLQKKYDDPTLRAAATAAHQAIIGVSDFVATFKDNPGRRLISLYAGSLMGLLVAGVLGLDLFQALLGLDTSTGASQQARLGGFLSFLPPGILPQVGVALTGLLMGLGSNPTHEVIRAIQEFKKNRKAENDPEPFVESASPSPDPRFMLAQIPRPAPGAPRPMQARPPAAMDAPAQSAQSPAPSAAAEPQPVRGIDTLTLRRAR